MEEVKNEILILTKELTENLSKSESEYLDILEKIKEKVKVLNNEQIQKKFNGIEYFVMNEDITIEENLNKALKYIEYFEKSVEKNIELIHINAENDKLDEEYQKRADKQDVPSTLVQIRKEMDEILGKSLFEGIENEYEFAIAYQLDDNDIDKFQILRKELKELLNNPEDNKNRIDDIRVEMFVILGVDPYTYKDNKKLIDNLEEPNKSRFAELKAKHDELLDKKKQKTIPTSEKTEGNGKKDDGSEKTKPTGLVPTSSTPTPEPEKKKKGRLVKFAKSAKEFYKRHKKAILITTGIVLAAIALPHVLPSIMYFNSVLWNNAILSSTSSVLPTALHDINLIIGSHIGATYAEASGIWTLANGTLLNATAAQAGILAALGKIALSAGTVGVGTTIAVKNAYKLAKEKIKKFKNREKKPKSKDEENKTNIFTNVKDSFAKGFEKGKEKVAEEWNKRKENKKNSESKNSPDNKKDPENTNNENKEFHRNDVSERINRIVNLLIDREYISKTEKEELEKVDKETFMTKFKEIYNRYNVDSVKKDNKEDKVEFNRTDINYSVTEFIKYCYETGVYTDEDIKKINKMESTELRDYVYADPRFAEFEKMRTEWSKEEPTPEVVEEEKGKGSK